MVYITNKYVLIAIGMSNGRISMDSVEMYPVSYLTVINDEEQFKDSPLKVLPDVWKAVQRCMPYLLVIRCGLSRDPNSMYEAWSK
jgi:hypothetical protein